MKNFLPLSVAALSACALFIAGCDKDDATPPLLTMKGAEVMTIYLNAPFNDPGVTANDNEDGNIVVSSNVSATNPDVNKVGTYYLKYWVEDAAGNKADTARRTVLVKNAAESMAGAYAVTGTCNSGFIDGIIVSTTNNNRIIFTQFGRYTNANAKLSADIIPINSHIDIVPATIFCGTIPTNRTFSGSGAITFSGDTIDISTMEITAIDTTYCDYRYIRQ